MSRYPVVGYEIVDCTFVYKNTEQDLGQRRVEKVVVCIVTTC